MTTLKSACLAVLGTLSFGMTGSALAHDFLSLDASNPLTAVTNWSTTLPLFDFDTDGCYPSAGISRSGDQNGGLSPTGSITGGCRKSDFQSYSNTYHRGACKVSGGNKYCGHFFALYFLKDQSTSLSLGESLGNHRHDWEFVAIWTKDNVKTHASASQHSGMETKAVAGLANSNGNIKFVYHKDGGLTHAFRFASTTEPAENSYGVWVRPPLASWWNLKSNSPTVITPKVMRDRLSTWSYGQANFPLRDDRFLAKLNANNPSGYPDFTQYDIDNTK